jgi:hypothetical protein
LLGVSIAAVSIVTTAYTNSGKTDIISYEED